MVVPESSINNIMGGLESTGGVTLHNHRRKLKTRFETIAKLGQGTYGKVQLGINKETGQEVAIKTIKKCKIETEADLIRIRREIQIMSSLRHPYIIHIYEVFENKDKMVLVMEYAAGGELYDYLSKKKVLDENEARRIFRQIAMAVYYCHKHQICHRDLKLENILLDEHGNAKIADFGLSNVFDKSRLLSTFCGSPLYASPEIVKGIPYSGPEVDCWSLGVLLYTLVYGAMPFDGSNFKRLVRQISAGEYFEPKNPSTASELIAGLLTVKGSERLDITGVCQHSWMAEEGKVSCYRLAVELAEQEPNRLDLLLALAVPPETQQIASVPEELNQVPERPARSMSLSSLPTVQPNFTPPAQLKAEETEPEKPPEREKKRERSRSRSRRKDSDEEKSKKKSVKVKKKSDPELSREEMEKVLEEARRLSDLIAQSPVAQPEVSAIEETKPLETKSDEVLPAPDPSDLKEVKEKSKDSKKVKKVKPEKENEVTASNEEVKESSKTKTKLKKEKEIDILDKYISPEKAKPKPEDVKIEDNVSVLETKIPQEIELKKNESKEDSSEIKETTPFRRDSIRRKSKVFEVAEVFAKSPTQEKVSQKKVFLPGVKVSDAKAAFERRSSVSQDSPSEPKKPDFSLASTINVNKLVQNELSKENKKEEKEKIKKENAVKVISHAISESEMNKASTLPRRRLSKPLIPKTESEHMVANSSVSQLVYPSPVPPPRPSLVEQDSGPKEHIIPIQIERRDDKPPPVSKQPSVVSSVSSRASSISSLGRQDSDSSTTTAGMTSMSTVCEPIRKSPREVIIPIAMEGGGYVTPSPSTLSKMSSVSEGEDDGPMRGFGLHSTRKRVEATDSLSSDEEDDNFEMLTAENLFSSLLSRVRNLTYRLNENEARPSFPRLFQNHSIFDSPSRRLTETKSFSDNQDTAPWRRKRDNASSSTLPRGFTTRSFRRTLTGGDECRREGRPPPATTSKSRKRSEDEVIEDFLATGKLSSLDRVRSYLEGLRRTNIEAPSPLRRYLSSEPLHSEYYPFSRHRFSSFDNSAQYDQPSSSKADISIYRQAKGPIKQSVASMNGHLMTDSLNYNGIEDVGHEKIVQAVHSEPANNCNNEHLNSQSDYLESDKLKNDLKATEKITKKDKNGSRVNKAIKSLRKKSEVYENEITESKLLKRAVSLEDLKFDEGGRGRRASSLKPEGSFEKRESPKAKKGGVFDKLSNKKEDREARIANLKRLDLVRGSEISADSTPTGDQDGEESMVSATDNSDTWSSCDYGERLFDPSAEECVSERIRRKSFYHRFNMPKRQAYNRTISNLERKRYY